MHTPNDDEIRDLAFAYWVEAGSPHGRDEEFWHRAAQELSEEAALDRDKGTNRVSQATPPAGPPTH